jgi:molecular chaperone HtpG
MPRKPVRPPVGLPDNTPQIDNAPQTSEFQIDLQGLIKLLAKNLYAEADVFVREMLQNAHDSIKRRREWQGEGTPDGVVRVKIDRQAATVTITDNGAGMTETEVREYLSTIGRSGTDAFRQDLVEKGRQAEVTVIGQFGIGLLSAFIVADRVVVETRSYLAENPAWCWESSGEKTYALQLGDRQDAGSTVTLHINEKHRDMLSAEELRKAIRKYADFLPVGIYLNEDETPTNAVNAPWHKRYGNPKEEVLEMAMFVAKRFPDNPLSTIPIHLTSPYKVDGVLYVSDNRIPDVNTTGLVDIYQSRMFVMEANRDMLPVWAKFVRGIIDSPALTLTASRDAIQQDAVQKEIKEQLGEAIIQHLTAFSKEDPIKFQRLCDWHHYHLKGMALREDSFFRAVADLIPFETNQGPMSLKAYFEEAKRQGQSETDLLYFDERGSATQFYMLCDARGLLVIDASQVFEDDFLERYGRLHPEIKLRQLNIGESDFIFEPLRDEEKETFRGLEMEFMRGIGGIDRRSVAKMVRFKPESIPALTVLTAAAKSQEKLKQAGDNPMIPDAVRNLVKDMMQGERTVPVTLYLNADNPTIQNLVNIPATEDKQSACIAIYNNALMLAQQVLTARNAELMFASFNRVIDRMIAQAEDAQKLNSQIFKLKSENQELKLAAAAQGSQQTEHVSCFFAMPFEDDYGLIEQALKRVLEDKPYGWQVILARDSHQERRIFENVRAHIARSHCYIAEISEQNPNVFLEIGKMSHYADRPLILLRRKGADEVPKDIGDFLYLEYDRVDDLEKLIQQVREKLKILPKELQALRTGKKTYLSRSILEQKADISRATVGKIADWFQTVEDLCNADAEQIAIELDIRSSSIQSAQEAMRTYFGLGG